MVLVRRGRHGVLIAASPEEEHELSDARARTTTSKPGWCRRWLAPVLFEESKIATEGTPSRWLLQRCFFAVVNRHHDFGALHLGPYTIMTLGALHYDWIE